MTLSLTSAGNLGSVTTTDATSPTGAAGAEEGTDAEKGFSRSILISGIRCVLTYVIFPFVAPALGVASGVGPIIGIIIGTIALAANAYSIRRFVRSNHKYRNMVVPIHLAVMVLLTILMVIDIRDLLA